jgi:hypothetical protein
MRAGLPLALTIGLVLSGAAHGQSVRPSAGPYESSIRTIFDTGTTRELLQPGTDLSFRVGSALQFIGNINLSPNPDNEVDLAGIELVPGLFASFNNSRGYGFIDYSLIGRLWEDSDYNALTHRLTATGRYQLLEDWFSVSAQATYGDTVVDPLRSYNYGTSGLFNRSNIAERASASITPMLNHDFRDFNLFASYTYGRVWYLDNGTRDVPESPVFTFFKDDSRDQRAYVGITSRDLEQLATLKVFYEWQASDFENTVPYRYERLGTELGFRLSRTLRFVGDVGLESDLDESTVAGGLDSTYWLAGLAWSPDSKTKLDVRFGERFFGNSLFASFRRETRYVTFLLSYVEDPDVETRRVGVNFDVDELPLPDPEDPSGLTSYPYVKKDATATIIADGAKTKLRFEIYSHERDYLTAIKANTDSQGVWFNALRVLGSDLYAEFDTRYVDAERGLYSDLTDPIDPPVDPIDPPLARDVIVNSKDWTIKGRVTWEYYQNLTTALEAGYLQRRGDLEYDGTWLALRFNYTF